MGIKPKDPNIGWDDLAQAIREYHDDGKDCISIKYLCYLLGWELIPGKPAQEETYTTIVVKKD